MNPVREQKNPAPSDCQDETHESRVFTGSGTRGRSYPLGATVCYGGVNFSVWSKSCTSLELLLFDRAEDEKPAYSITLDPRRNRTFFYWHIFVPGLSQGQIYGYRAHGPFEPHKGMRFDSGKILLDPYGKSVTIPDTYDRLAASVPGNNTGRAMKSVVFDARAYDWEGDTPLKRPFSKTVIYEMHVGGFTKNPNSGVSPGKRGTYAGLVEKIPYLKELGVTAIELLPVFQFDPQDCPQGLVNYWGYCPVSFFSPHTGYSSDRNPVGAIREFRDMVKALHRAGIEVILDVVYNHTAEGNHAGPTLCFKGLSNKTYYILDPQNASYMDYTGTGNTLNGNHPVVRRMILDSLIYWVREMHVDGFRFDLASILSRDENGRPMENPPVLWDIDSDPVLSGTKLIAEAWDAAGLYQVGSFVGDRWKEWNGKFRDDVRSFLKGDCRMVSRLSARMIGSPDIFGHEEREPEQSINFVTCHDGFTLNDLVSYNAKHNDANLENNRDGSDFNLSWNCGQEGPADNQELDAMRTRQVKNFLALTLLSVGTPMILMGDEVRRTQRGNNNAYCQDNETSWFDWSLIERHRDIHRFVRHMIRARIMKDGSSDEHSLSLNELIRRARIQWHGIRLHQPDWSDDSHSLACTIWSTDDRYVLHFIINAYWEPLVFEVPPLGNEPRILWRRWIDTYLPSPEDIRHFTDAPEICTRSYTAMPRSVVVLFAVFRTEIGGY